MSLRNLFIETMVELTGPLLDPSKHRPVLESIPLAAALLPMLQRALDDLHLTQPQDMSSEITRQIVAIQDEQLTLDMHHDRKMRGFIGLTTAHAEIEDDEKKAQQYLDLRDHACPDGLKGTTKSYMDEAGAAKLMPARLTEQDEQLLDKIPLPDGGNARQLVEAWTADAKELGELEEKKLALQKQADAMQVVRPADALKAKNQWIRVVRAMETNLELAGASQEIIDTILGPLYEAEAKADRRAAGTQGSTPSGGSKEPTQSDATEGTKDQ